MELVTEETSLPIDTPSLLKLEEIMQFSDPARMRNCAQHSNLLSILCAVGKESCTVGLVRLKVSCLSK
jgi:hypothetical protein